MKGRDEGESKMKNQDWQKRKEQVFTVEYSGVEPETALRPAFSACRQITLVSSGMSAGWEPWSRWN